MKTIDWTNWDWEETLPEDEIRSQYNFYFQMKFDCAKNKRFEDANNWRQKEFDYVLEHKDILKEEFKRYKSIYNL